MYLLLCVSVDVYLRVCLRVYLSCPFLDHMSLTVLDIWSPSLCSGSLTVLHKPWELLLWCVWLCACACVRRCEGGTQRDRWPQVWCRCFVCLGAALWCVFNLFYPALSKSQNGRVQYPNRPRLGVTTDADNEPQCQKLPHFLSPLNTLNHKNWLSVSPKATQYDKTKSDEHFLICYHLWFG